MLTLASPYRTSVNSSSFVQSDSLIHSFILCVRYLSVTHEKSSTCRNNL